MNNYQIVTRTDIGEREENQDCVRAILNNDEHIMILCDGMGGHVGGKLASEMCVNEMEHLLTTREHRNIKAFFEYSLDVIDAKVGAIKDENGKLCNAGSTLVTAVIKNGELNWLSVGDSRLYVIRDHRINQMTRDHTVELLAKVEYSQGKISIQEYDDQMLEKDTLCSYMGKRGNDIFDINSLPLLLKRGDVIILATDGLYKSLDNDDIVRIVDSSVTAEEIGDKLIYEATKIAKGCNQDNTSLIVCKVN